MENYNFLDFTKEHYPEIWEEFFRYKRKETPPTIGAEVVTLRNGFHGYKGETRYVVPFKDERYVGLAIVPNGEPKAICEIETWWKDLKIVNEPKINEVTE